MSLLRVAELLQDDEKKGVQARVVLSRAEPHRICAANSAFTGLSGWESDELARRSLDVLHGPATNSSMLRAVMRSASEGGSESECCVVLYNKDSLSKVYLIRFELCPSRAGEEDLMTATFSGPVETLQMEQVVQDLPMCKEARIIAHSNHPFLVTNVSQSWLDEFGCKEEEVRGGSLKTLDGTGTNGHLLLDLMKSVKRGLTRQLTLASYKKSGIPVVIFLKCRPILGKTGDLDHFVADATCVPAMMLSTAVAAENDSAMVVALDKKSTVVWASSPLCHTIGWQRSKFEGRTVKCILGPKSKATTLYDCFEAASTGLPLPESVLNVYKTDGTSVICAVSATPLLDDDSLRVTHIKVKLEPSDVLAMKDAVTALDDSDAKFIALAAAPFTIKNVNKAWCQLYSLAEDKAVGRSLRVIQGPGTSGTVFAELKSKVAAGKKFTTPITTYNTRGIPLQTTVSIVPILSDNGEFECFQGVILDCNATPHRSEYPITPTGHITHINGYTQLVLYPKADPTLEHCIDYLCHLKEANIVRSWNWHGDALKVNVDTQRVLEHTKGSAWCQKWTADLRTWHAWWNRMLWVVSEASKKQHEEEEEMASDFSFLGEMSESDSGSGGESKEEHLFKLEQREESSSGDDSKGKDSGKSSGESGKSSGGTGRSTSTMTYGSTETLTRLGRELVCMGLEDAGCLLDAKGRVIFANEAFLRNNGYEGTELNELSWTALLCPGTDRDVMSQFEDFLAEQGSNPFEARILLRRKDGSTYWGSMLAEAVTFQSNSYVIPCFCVSVEDATELIDAEAEAEEGDIENDPLSCAMLEELEVLQHRCVNLFKLGLAHVETTISTDSSSDDDEREKGPFTEIVIALPPGASHAHCMRTLNALKERQVVQSFAWEADTIRVYANINALYRCMEYVEPVKDSWPVAMGFKQWLTTVLTVAYELKSEQEILPEPWTDPGSDHQHGIATDLAFLSEEMDDMPGEVDSGSVGSVEEEEEEEGFKVKEELLQLEVRVLMKELDRMQTEADYQRAVAEDDESKNTQTISKLQSELEVCRKLIEFQHRELAACETDKFVSESAIRAMKGAMDNKVQFVQQLRQQMETDRQVMRIALDTISRLADSNGAEVGRLTADKERLEAENSSLKRICARMGSDWAQSGLVNLSAPSAKSASTEFLGGGSSSSSSSPNATLPSDIVQEFRHGIEAKGVKTAMCLCDDMGAIAWSNLLFSRITGYSAAEVEGCIWSSFLCGPVTDTEDLAWMQRTIKMREADARCLRCYHATGRLFWLQVVMAPAMAVGQPCVLISFDDVTEIFERLLLHGDFAENDSAAVAAERISQLQQYALDSGKEVLMRVSQQQQQQQQSAGKHTSQSFHDFPFLGPLPTWARTRPPEIGDESEFDDIVLYPNGDTMELLKTGLLWQLKAAGLVSTWSWSWEHDGALKVRLNVSLVLSRSERMLSPMFASDMSGWRLWWSRLLCALSAADAKIKEAGDDDGMMSDRRKSLSTEGSSAQLSENGMVGMGNAGVLYTTLLEAQAESEEARAICSAREPWLILEANEAFVRLTSFAETEIKGRSLAMMQGAVDWPVLVNAMQSLVRTAGKAGEACIMSRSIGVQSYKRGGEPFQNFMSLVPIMSEGEFTHVLAVFRELPEDQDSNQVIRQPVRHAIAA